MDTATWVAERIKFLQDRHWAAHRRQLRQANGPKGRAKRLFYQQAQARAFREIESAREELA